MKLSDEPSSKSVRARARNGDLISSLWFVWVLVASMVAAESSNWVFIGCEIFLFSLVLNWVAGGIFPSQVKSRRRKNAWRKSNKQQFGPRPRNYRKKRIATKALLPRHAELLPKLQIDREGDEMAAERKAETERLAECRKEKDAALMRHAEEVARQQQEAKAAREAAKTDALANATTIARGSVIHPKLISAAPRHLHVYLSKPKDMQQSMIRRKQMFQCQADDLEESIRVGCKHVKAAGPSNEEQLLRIDYMYASGLLSWEQLSSIKRELGM
jgi:hypothetical protein